MKENGEMFAFIFDSGKFDSSFYGEIVFEEIVCGGELIKNPFKIVVSLGDLFFSQKIIDIEPYVYNDQYCTIDFQQMKNYEFSDYPYCWVIEDILPSLAVLIDKRLRNSVDAYIGLARIEINNSSRRQQFWKNLIRSFAVEKNIIISFNSIEEGAFSYQKKAKEYGYEINYDILDVLDNSNFRKSSHVKTEKDLEIISPKNRDINRDIMSLNFSIREEVQISGALIWKSINALEKVYFEKTSINTSFCVEYPFLTLYLASQGVERIQKSLIELICKNKHINESEKDEVYKLLMSHSHNILNEWIEKNVDIKISRNGRKLLNILSSFYNTTRYARYNDDNYLDSTTPELDLLMKLRDKDSKSNENIKSNFGKYLGEICIKYYCMFIDLCRELGIYSYELDPNSSANLVCFYKKEKKHNLYEEYKNKQLSKKEILYWLLKEPNKYPDYRYSILEPLDLDQESIKQYLYEILCFSEEVYNYYDEVDSYYDELYRRNKAQWDERIKLMNFMFNNEI